MASLNHVANNVGAERVQDCPSLMRDNPIVSNRRLRCCHRPAILDAPRPQETGT